MFFYGFHDEPGQKRIRRSGQAKVYNPYPLNNGEVYRLGQRPATAPRLGASGLAVPARFRDQKVSIRSDSKDPDLTSGPGRNHACDGGAVTIGCERLLTAFHEVGCSRDSALEVRMVCLYASVDDGHADTATCHPGMGTVGAYYAGPILKWRVRISGARLESLEDLIKLDRFDARIGP